MGRPVVMVRILYGLGNQMFQYAAGRRLAQRLDAELLLDLSGYAYYPLRRYGLDAFNISARIATPEEARGFSSFHIESRLGKMAFRAWQKVARRGWTILYENQAGPVDRRVLEAKGNVYLGGYWQSEQYFADIGETIRREFTLKAEPSAESRELAERIRSTESVGVHVRRGDNVWDPDAAAAVGTCDPSYYDECLRRIRGSVPSPSFFVFSDEPDWARTNLSFGGPTTYVVHNGPERDHEDLWLMSLCRHQIIANSSFSWWAAWLNGTPGKRVFTPLRYCRSASIDTRDIVPSTWAKV